MLNYSFIYTNNSNIAFLMTSAEQTIHAVKIELLI